MYGLKQSPHFWYKKLSSFSFEKIGLRQINADHSIFVTSTGLDGLVFSTFVDDIKIMAPKKSRIIEQVKSELTSAFSMVDMGPVSFYLGLKVECNQVNRKIKLSQLAYINKVLSKFHLNKAHTINTLMKESTILE